MRANDSSNSENQRCMERMMRKMIGRHFTLIYGVLEFALFRLYHFDIVDGWMDMRM